MSENDTHAGRRFGQQEKKEPSKLLSLKEIRRTMSLSPKGIAHMFQVIKNNRKKPKNVYSIDQLLRDTRRYYGLPSDPNAKQQLRGRVKSLSEWRGQP